MFVEYFRRACADKRLQHEKTIWREHRRDHFSLLIVRRRIERDEARLFARLASLEDRDAADLGVGREHAVIAVDRDDVAMLGHRPIGAELAARAVVETVLR